MQVTEEGRAYLGQWVGEVREVDWAGPDLREEVGARDVLDKQVLAHAVVVGGVACQQMQMRVGK